MIKQEQISKLLPYMTCIATQKVNQLTTELFAGADIDGRLRDIVLYHMEYQDHFSVQSGKDPVPVFNEVMDLIEKDIAE